MGETRFRREIAQKSFFVPVNPNPTKGDTTMPITAIPAGLLWPPSSVRDMPPGAIEGATGYAGPGLDLGALRTNEQGHVQILWVRTPTQADQRNAEWLDFDPTNSGHVRKARHFGRYGPGASYGAQEHDEVVAWYETVHGPQGPDWSDSMDRWDLEHDNAARNALQLAARAKQGQEPNGAEVELLRTRLADAIKAREDAEKKLETREAALLAEREVAAGWRKASLRAMDMIGAAGKVALTSTEVDKGGKFAKGWRALGTELLRLERETREKLGG